MNVLESKEATKEELERIINILNKNHISYHTVKYCDSNKICIELGRGEEKQCCNKKIRIYSCQKDIHQIYLHEIIYIAIEGRKTVVYLKDKRIETRYTMEYWDNLLESEAFAHPHKSFLVNLNYVYEVTKDFVKVSYGDKEYSVYTSSRKISAFKKAFLNFKG